MNALSKSQSSHKFVVVNHFVDDGKDMGPPLPSNESKIHKKDFYKSFLIKKINPFEVEFQHFVQTTKINLSIARQGVQPNLLLIFMLMKLKYLRKEIKYKFIHFGWYQIVVNPKYHL
jgi:hypothetical protein